MATILCGDIGGTNSRLRLFKVGADEQIDGANVPGELLFQKEYANETYARCAQLTLHRATSALADYTQHTVHCASALGPAVVCYMSQRRIASTGLVRVWWARYNPSPTGAHCLRSHV